MNAAPQIKYDFNNATKTMLTKPEFLSILESIPEEIAPHQAGKREMLNVELFFICQRASQYLQPHDLIFESGVWKGRSSAILAAFAITKQCDVISCCSEQNESVERVDRYFGNFDVIYGRGENYIKTHSPQVVVCDGPKANTPDGVKFLIQSANNESVKILFQHDVHKEPDSTNFLKVAADHGKTPEMITKQFIAENIDLDGCRGYSPMLGLWT